MKKNMVFIDREFLLSSIRLSLSKFHPKSLIKNPVIFVTMVGAVLSVIASLEAPTSFNIQISLWLLLTVFFANFSEALAEGKGKAQASSLRKNKEHVRAVRFHLKERREEPVRVEDLKKGEFVICCAGEIIPLDGEVIEGVASVDESAITGESAPVIRESGGDRSGVTGGTTIKSDWLVIKITSLPGDTFVDKMIMLIEGARRQKTPNEVALSLVLSGISILLLGAVISLKFFGDYTAKQSGNDLNLTLPILISLLVCLIPTTIGGLLSAIGISGMSRLVKNNIIAKSGKAVEAAGDISVLLLDKTGTITHGNRQAHEFIPAPNVTLRELAEVAWLSSLADETPEGRSIVDLAIKSFSFKDMPRKENIFFVPFTAETRMSGVDIDWEERGIQTIRKGATDSIIQFVEKNNGECHPLIKKHIRGISEEGGTPLLVACNKKIYGVIYLKDIVKPGIKEKFAELRTIGIKTIMITGDNPLTAASIAAEAGVDDFIAEATPEQKLKKIREEQSHGHLVAMTGDGTNDAPALAQADVGVAMNSGTQAAKEAGNMVDLDSDPTKLIKIVEVGKQLLITRGALTTFSFANDIAKYFAILPAIFLTAYANSGGPGPLSHFNVMNLQSPESAILSAVIFNAVIIIFLTPLALRGVKYKSMTSEKMLLQNLLVYGVGGVLSPFFGIKGIDLIINAIGII